jgi:hypothetical protein
MKFTGLTEETIKEAIQRRENSKKRSEQEKTVRAKPYIQQKISSFTEAQPTMKEVMAMLKDIQMKVDFLFEHRSQPE